MGISGLSGEEAESALEKSSGDDDGATLSLLVNREHEGTITMMSDNAAPSFGAEEVKSQEKIQEGERDDSALEEGAVDLPLVASNNVTANTTAATTIQTPIPPQETTQPGALAMPGIGADARECEDEHATTSTTAESGLADPNNPVSAEASCGH